MRGEVTDWQLAATFRAGMQMWDSMRASGAPLQACVDTLARSLKAAWPTRASIQEWPAQHRVPRCPKCDGYGLIMREVVNRLGCEVREGTPCVCWAGEKFKDRPKSQDDFTTAGKVPVKKGFTRWNG